MKKKFTILIAAAFMLLTMMASTGTMWGQNTSSLIFTAKCNGSGTADDGAEWTVTSDGTESTFDETKGIHYGTGSSSVKYITLTTSDISGTITSIVVNASVASGVSAVLNVTVGGNSFGTQGQSTTTSATDYTFTGSASGEIVVTHTKPSKANKALYVKSIIVTYTTGGTPTSNVALTSVDNVDLTATYSGGTLTEGDDADIDQGASVTLAYANVATGYVFGSWVITKQSDSSDVTADVLNGSTLSVPAYGINISASIPQDQQYTVTFDAGSGTCDPGSVTNYPGTIITLPSATPSANCASNGWTFVGWTTSNVNEGTTTTPDPLYTANTSYPIGNTNITLYAVYRVVSSSTTQEFNFAAIASANNWSSGTAYTTVTLSPVTLTANGGGNNGKYYSSDNSWRIYNGGSVTVSTTTGSVLGVTSTPSKTFTINGNGTASFAPTATTQFTKINVNYGTYEFATSPACNPKVATPELSLSTGTYPGTQSVTINCTTEGASIYYTLDGTDPTSASTPYNGAISITETKTLKAIAVLNGYSDSDIAEATYTIVTPFTTMQQVYEDAVANTSEHDVYITFNNWVITGTNGGSNPSQFFLTDSDNEYGCVIYGSGSGFVKDNTLNGTVKCKLQYFGSSYKFAELTNLTISTSGLEVGTGGNVTPVVTTIDALASAKTGTVVTLNNLTYNGTVLTDEGNHVINLSNNIYSATLTSGTKYNITGVFTLGYSLNDTYNRINPRSSEDVVEVVVINPTISATPTSLTGFTYAEGNGPSTAKTISVSGTNLEGSITLALGASSNFEISLSPDAGYTNSLTLTPEGGTVAATTVYVRMKAGLEIANNYSGQITLTSTNATAVAVSLSGTVTGPQVTWDLSTATYSSASETLVTWSSDYVTMTNAKGITSTQNANAYLNSGDPAHTRFYSGHVLTFTPSTGYAISSIEITAYSSSYANVFKNGTWVNGAATVNNSIVTVIPTNINIPVSVTLGSAAWAYSVTVSYEVSTLTPHNITNDVDMENGTVVANPTSAVAGATVTLTIYPAAGYILADDTDLEVDGDSGLASLNKVNAGTFTFEMPNEDVTVYAIFSHYSGTYYTLVNSTADLIPGRHYIITNSKEPGDAYVMAAHGSNYREAASATVVGNIIYQTASAHEIVLSGDNTNFWTLYDDGTAATSQGYLYALAGNKLNRRLDNSGDNNGKWTININGDGEAVIVSQIDNASNTIRFNNSTSPKRFTCYASGQQSVYLYMKADETDFDLYSNTNYNSLTIGGIDIYTVHSPAVLNVTGTLNTEDDPENLIIENGAQLKYSHTDNLNVYATVKKKITGYGAGNEDLKAHYNLITQPLDYTLLRSGNPGDPLIENTGMLNDNYDFYKWDFVCDDEWKNYKAEGSDFNMNNNLYGYLYAHETDIELSFKGPLCGATTTNSRILTIEEGDHEFNGWYLIGNSFVCNAYLVDAETNGTALPYYRMNEAGDDFTAVDNGAVIAPMEGIFYKAEQNQTVWMVTTAPAPVEAGKGNLNLEVAQVVTNRDAHKATDNAIIRFDGGSTLEKFSFSENNAKLYFTQNSKDYAVVNADNQGEMPVYFKAAENGTYTISFSMDNVEFGYLHLIDNKTGNDVDLRQTPSYTFEASTIDYASRFRLVFRATGNDNDSENNDFGFFDANGNFLVLGIEGTATLQVIDVTGRILSTETFSGDYSKAINAKAGVYMLRLIQGSDVRTQKVVVK